VFTAANDALEAEDLIGGEVGPELALAPGASVRVTGFWNALRNPVGNVTLDPADPTQRQRQNLGEARIRGVEASAQWSPAPRWAALAAYTWVDSRVTSAPAAPEVEGNRLAQDPVHRAVVGLAFDDPRRLLATVQARYLGAQFEDDLNTLPMPGFLLVDALVSRRLWSGFEVYAAVENLFDKQYLVGRAGIDTWGQPRTIRVGLRLRDLRGR
jgi:iron complex outermembrane recepter protein